MWVDLDDDLEPRSVVLPRRTGPAGGGGGPLAAAAPEADYAAAVREFIAAGGEWAEGKPEAPQDVAAPLKPWDALRPGPAQPPCSIGGGAARPAEYKCCLGLDLGSCNTTVSAWNGRTAVVLRSFQYSSTSFPSMVAYKDDGTVLAGHAALRQYALNPTRTIHSLKSWIGRPWSADLDRPASRSYPLVHDAVRDVVGVPIAGRDRPVTATELAAVLIEQVRAMAMADHLRHDVRDVVVTVPLRYTSVQRDAVKRACELAGLTVLMVMDEPRAALLAAGLHATKTEVNLWQRKLSVVVDLGGSAVGVSVMHTGHKRMEVLAHKTDAGLGGDDFDRVLYEHLRQELPKKNKGAPLPLGADGKLAPAPHDAIRLMSKCREVKEALAEVPNQSYEVEVANRTYKGSLTRAKLNMLYEPLVTRAVALLDAALKEASVARGSVDDVVLVGGASKLKRMQDMIEKFFLGSKAFLVKPETPEHLVAQGAAIQAAVMGEEGPAEIAAPQLPIAASVVPQAVGVAVENHAYAVVIPRNACIPASQQLEKHLVYHTTRDGQTSLKLAVYQGDATKASENFLLGCCTLEGIPAQPAGSVDVCVQFTFDESGWLEVRMWVQGQGEVTASLLVTEDAYERHQLSLDGALYPQAAGEKGAAISEFWVEPKDVPMDRDDIARQRAREQEAQRQRELRKKEKKAAKERKNRAKEQEEQERIIRHQNRRGSRQTATPTQQTVAPLSGASSSRTLRNPRTPPPSTPLKAALSSRSFGSLVLDPKASGSTRA
eukprot:TRINITY_DN6030_c0_g1_i1.p1 TRINITY_DN6030_c0_g1~~TRINITY_DN6030_c0_g1_i1.p1  ORF type:complete len:793 (+),score=281.65 TRINITY_DN6030_c0_g1_i1:64-2379(+)